MKYFSLIFCLSISVIRTERNCPSGWLDSTDEGLGCLLFSNSPMDWVEANAFCKESGSTTSPAALIEIEDSLQLEFLKGIIPFLEPLV